MLLSKNFLNRKEQAILDSIVVASENNPNKPEFPPEKPKFPATPTYEIKLSGFSISVSDSSFNSFGILVPNFLK